VVSSGQGGEETTLKYQRMFRACGMVLVHKVDLLEHLEYDLDRCLYYLDQVHPGVEDMLLSARTGDGVEAWRDWLGSVAHRQRVAA